MLPLVLEDAIKVGITRDTGIIAPVLRRIQELLVPVPYKQWQTLSSAPGSPELRLKFHPAGHILGSAYVEFALPYASLNQGVAHKDTRVVFSGDLGAPYAPLLPAPKSLTAVMTWCWKAPMATRTTATGPVVVSSCGR